jgi:2-C-methyl-D-erythritol 2,4-cyclodiphosphate synthase
MGFDSHTHAPDRPLRLGGVAFEGEAGLAGHSDGDVLCHALADALLGAIGLEDIGRHFPDDVPETEGMAGLDLLARTVLLLREAGFRPVSCDCTVVAERPVLAPRRDEIRESLAGVLGIEPGRVSVKGKRPEGVGLSADGAACFALAVVDRS